MPDTHQWMWRARIMGTVMDIDERKRAEQALRSAQAQLAHIARLTMMAKLAASIAHEISNPLAAVATNAEACLRWLNRDEPDLDEAQDAVSSIASESIRAGEMIRGLQALLADSNTRQT